MNYEIEPKQDFQLVGGIETSLHDLLGHAIDEPRNRQIGEMPTRIGRSPAFIFGERRPGNNEDTVYTLVLRDSVRDKRLNQIYWEMAPGNAFKLDYNDVVNDSTTLLLYPEDNKRIIAMHEQTGNAWKRYRHFGPSQLSAIQHNSSDTLIPMLRWWNNNGKRKFVYSPHMHTPEGNAALKDFLAGEIPKSSLASASLLDPTLGLYVLAVASPEIKSEWPARDKLYEDGTARQIGSTQAPLNTLMKEESLLEAPLLDIIEERIGR